MEKSTIPSNIITRSAKKSSDGSRLHQDSKKNAAKSPATADAVRKKTEEAQKAPKDSAEPEEEKSRPIVYLGFNDCCSGKLPTGYNRPLMATDEVGRLLVRNCCQPVSYR